MKFSFGLLVFAVTSVVSIHSHAQAGKAGAPAQKNSGKNLYMDVHQLPPGKVDYNEVAKAHAKDLAVEGKYGVHMIKYWVNKDKGQINCLVSASDTASIIKTHAEAHGLMPQRIYKMTDGVEAAMKGNNDLFLDVHYLGAGNVSAKAVEGAHQKDLAVQHKYGVNLINYWVDEKEGVVMCLAQAKDSASLIRTHKEAHGLLPAYVLKVKQGQ